MAAGATAGAIAATVCNPLDLLKTQLQATGASGARSYQYSTAAGATRHIVGNSSRGVLALWTGVGVSIPRSMMSTSVMMTTQTKLKERALSLGCQPQLATMGAALGAAACTIYSQAPLDIVRARIFSPRQGFAGPTGAGAVVVARRMMAEEGWRSFWGGAGVNFIRYAPHAVLSFFLIDLFKTTAAEHWTSK